MDHRSSQRTKLHNVLVVGAGAAVLAVTVFKVPLATILLVGLWLVCPLMMMGMHGGGHGRVDSRASGSETRGSTNARRPIAAIPPEDRDARRTGPEEPW